MRARSSHGTQQQTSEHETAVCGSAGEATLVIAAAGGDELPSEPRGALAAISKIISRVATGRVPEEGPQYAVVQKD